MVKYDKIKKGSSKDGSGTENLDFDYKILVFKQIDRINLARTHGKMNAFFAGVDTLSDFLEPYAVDSKKYQAKIIEIIDEYDEDIKNTKNNDQKKREAINNKYRKHMRALMLLIHENDLLPEQSGEYTD